MKSVLQAAWLLTVAFGNFVVVIIAKLALFNKQVRKYARSQDGDATCD